LSDSWWRGRLCQYCTFLETVVKKHEDVIIVVVSVAFLLLAALLFVLMWFNPSALARLRLFFPDQQ
jgi:hypothetical protein